MTNILNQICQKKLKHIENQKKIITQSDLEEKIRSLSPTFGFIKSIEQKISSNETAIIAELKKASPSKGLIREDFNIAKIARSYEQGGATCLSILTDQPYFQGRDEYINIARENCNLPILRKDFILDIYQIFEARAIGADCILLIMAALDLEHAKKLEQAAKSLNLDVLVEVHNEYELKQALELDTKLIGINNRNLKDMSINLNVTINLSKQIPQDKIIVCESGIYTNSDIKKMQKYGINSFLVGESLMRKDDIESGLRELLVHAVI